MATGPVGGRREGERETRRGEGGRGRGGGGRGVHVLVCMCVCVCVCARIRTCMCDVSHVRIPWPEVKPQAGSVLGDHGLSLPLPLHSSLATWLHRAMLGGRLPRLLGLGWLGQDRPLEPHEESALEALPHRPLQDLAIHTGRDQHLGPDLLPEGALPHHPVHLPDRAGVVVEGISGLGGGGGGGGGEGRVEEVGSRRLEGRGEEGRCACTGQCSHTHVLIVCLHA